ncbi:MAG: acyl-CoA dehydrogenase, partial [Pseudomonadota bacterium]
MDGTAGSAIATDVILDGLTERMSEAVTALEAYATAAKAAAATSLAPNGKPDRDAFNLEQHKAHGLAWVITYVETLRETANWAARLDAEGKFGEIEQLLSQILFAEYTAQLIGGIPMNQGETVRPADLGLTDHQVQLLFAPALQDFLARGKTPAVMAAAARHLPDSLSRASVEDTGL